MDSLRIATEPEPIELAWRLLRSLLATVQFLKHDLRLNPLSYPAMHSLRFWSLISIYLPVESWPEQGFGVATFRKRAA